jgi:hypothetical protein
VAGSNKQTGSVWLGIFTFLALEALVGAQALFSYWSGFLTVAQMHQRGILHGLPFLWHFGMWGDIFIISPLAAIIVVRCWEQWKSESILFSAALAVMATYFMSYIYSLSEMPEAHQVTAVGFLHEVYMATALTVFILLYFFTPQANRTLLISATALLTVHLFLGTHMVLGAVAGLSELAWYPASPLRSPVGWATIMVVVFGLGWRVRGLLHPRSRFFLD